MMTINEVFSTPNKLFDSIQENDNYIDNCKKLIKDFAEKVRDKSVYLDITIQFIDKSAKDCNRSWGIAILKEIGKDENVNESVKEKVFQSLMDLFDKKYYADKEQEGIYLSGKKEDNENPDKENPKRKFRNTRFYAISAIKDLAKSDKQRSEMNRLMKTLSQDKEESYLVQAEALAILADGGDKRAEEKIRERLGDKDYWIPYYTLRALNEVPLPALTDDIIKIMNTSKANDYKYWAIVALGNLRYSQNSKIARALGDLAISEPISYLRLEAIKSLAERKDANAFSDLLKALEDSNAEIRVQASKAIEQIVPKEKAIRSIVEQALNKETDKEIRTLLTKALRDIDKDRTVSSEILSRSLGGEDVDQARTAREMLIDLGGWAAIQSVAQRRMTLGDLDKLLTESEKVVKDTFQATIHQARINFYFALIVNILIVIMGLAISTIAIGQLIKDPNKYLDKWILTGAAGLFGVIITMYFNDPRKNAREDLTALMNVNVIFLGFLRQLNEIDATFKHAYIEKQSFGKEEMLLAVEQIKLAIEQTLNMTARHLGAIQKEKSDKELDKIKEGLQTIPSSASGKH